MIEPVPGMAGSAVTARSGLMIAECAVRVEIDAAVIDAAADQEIVARGRTVCRCSLACSEAPNVVAWLAVRSIVPHGVAPQVLPLPGGQGIGLLFWSRMANCRGTRRSPGSAAGSRILQAQMIANCGLALLLHRSKSAALPSMWSCAKPRM